MTREPEMLAAVGPWILAHPWDALGRRWNYKSALLSAAIRGPLFFAINLSSGLPAALAALTTESCFRAVTAGFYGALTQAFRRVEPERAAMLAAMFVLPAAAHTLEALVHWLGGTPELLASLVASVALTVVSTSFNLFAMRRGALVVGEHQQSLRTDLRSMPRLVTLFVASTVRACVRSTA